MILDVYLHHSTVALYPFTCSVQLFARFGLCTAATRRCNIIREKLKHKRKLKVLSCNRFCLSLLRCVIVWVSACGKRRPVLSLTEALCTVPSVWLLAPVCLHTESLAPTSSPPPPLCLLSFLWPRLHFLRQRRKKPGNVKPLLN